MDDSRRLGWLVLDMRAMKQAALLHAPDGDAPGAWHPLASPAFKGDKGNTAPEVRVFAALREVQLVTAAAVKGAASDDPSTVTEAAVTSDGPVQGGQSPRSSHESRKGRGEIFDENTGGSDGGGDVSLDHSRQLSASQPITVDGAEGIEGVGATEVLHLFSLTTDVRSFRSSRRMPFPTASIVVRLTLPHCLLDAVELGGRTPAAVATPVRTNPPVTVSRASEVMLQHGSGTVDFGAGVMALATALAAGPRLIAEVWHKDRYTSDQLLGTATVSLAPLLQEPVMDGYAPVMAAIVSGGDRNPRSVALLGPDAVKAVTVGELRLVLSLAEKGPLPLWATKMSAYDRFPLSQSHEELTKPKPVGVGAHGSVGEPGGGGRASLRASLERAAAVTTGGGGGGLSLDSSRQLSTSRPISASTSRPISGGGGVGLGYSINGGLVAAPESPTEAYRGMPAWGIAADSGTAASTVAVTALAAAVAAAPHVVLVPAPAVPSSSHSNTTAAAVSHATAPPRTTSAATTAVTASMKHGRGHGYVDAWNPGP
jgi:centrosomal protein CEP120